VNCIRVRIWNAFSIQFLCNFRLVKQCIFPMISKHEIEDQWTVQCKFWIPTEEEIQLGQCTDIHGTNNCIHHAIKTTWRVFRVGFRFKWGECSHIFRECKWIYGKIYLNRGERYELMIDRRGYTHNLSSCEIKAWKKFRPEWYLNTMTSALPV